MSDEYETTSTAENEALRATYQYGVQEPVPPHLDDAVLRNARADVRKDRGFSWFSAWRRPAAFIATVGLSLAIVIELGDLAIFEQDPLSRPDPQQDFATEAAESPARIRQIGEIANQRALGENIDIKQLIIPTGGDAVCNDAQIRTPDSWLACVVQLRADGFSEEARTEMGKLLLAYPGFTAPE